LHTCIDPTTQSMKKYFSLLFFLCFISVAHAQTKVVVGRILDSVSLKPIQDVLVVNKATSLTTLTNEDGFFYLKMNRTDTLVLYLIAYYPRYFYVATDAEYAKQAHVMMLKPNIEQLKEVEVFGKRKEVDKYPFNSVPATILNPMSFLYERYSKKYRQYSKLQEIIEKKDREEYLQRLRNQRFTKELVMAVTEIEPEEVAEFMQKSSFSKSFLEQANDYELMVEIIKKYKWWTERK
jgi:hypothetical protein